MTNEEREIRQKLKDDFLHYAKRCLRIRTKSGTVNSFELNDAQKYIHEKVEEQRAKTGKVRAIILKGRQQGCCLKPSTRVLTSSLEWVPLSEVVVGSSLVAVDENITGGKGNTRKMRTSVVEKIWTVRKPAYKITLEDGRSVTCSANHRWLSRKSNVQPQWRSVGGESGAPDNRSALKCGDYLRAVTDTWEYPTIDDAWFGGIIDGEGSLDFNGTGASLAVSQVAGAVLDKMVSVCCDRGYEQYIVSDDGPRKTKFGSKPVHAVNVSGMRHLFRLMGLSRPLRFIDKQWWVGKRLPDNSWQRIISIEPVGEIDLIDIQTSTQTYIAEGIVSHNSTYVEGRFYWRVTHTRGVRAFILTHDEEATNNLFELANRYHQNCPLPVKPSTSAANAKELHFDRLDSGYKVGTAGNKAVGRSSTVQFFHGSEVGFWPNAQQHAAGILQAIPDAPGTESFLESTANGIGNFFHQQWQMAEAGQSDYIAIFVPWYWQPEYKKAVPDGFSLTEEERTYKKSYGLTDEQIAWRRFKIVELKDETLFKQEYPATAAEAFQVSGLDPYIKPEMVIDARKTKVDDEYGDKKLGVDPARFGTDRTSICYRQGRKVHWIRSYSKKDTMEVAGLVRMAIREVGAQQCAIDVGGLGAGVYDRVKELVSESECQIVQVNSAESPVDAKKYTNKRAEMWGEVKDWLENKPVSIPDSDELQADLTQIRYTWDSNNALKMEKKEDMAKRGFRSPDTADALGLTFAKPIIKFMEDEYDDYSYQGRSSVGGY